jgi:hypothetical protein
MQSRQQVGGRRLDWTREKTEFLSNRAWMGKREVKQVFLESRCSGNEG